MSRVGEEVRGSVLSDRLHERIVNQPRMRGNGVVRGRRDHVLGNVWLHPAGDQVEPQDRRRAVPPGNAMHVNVAPCLAHAIMNHVNALDCIRRGNSDQVFNGTPYYSRERPVRLGQLVRRFADVDDVRNAVSPQSTEKPPRSESSLPDVSRDVKQSDNPV